MIRSITSVFNTNDFESPDEKLEAFRGNLGIVVDISPEKAFVPQLDACLRSTMLGGVLMTEMSATRQRFSRNQVNIGLSGLDHFQLVLIKQGNKLVKTDEGEQLAKAGDIMLFDLAENSSSTTNVLGLEHGKFETLNFIFAREQIEAFLPFPHRYHGMRLNLADPMVIILRDFLLSLSQQVKRLDQAQADRLATPIIELLATTLSKHPDVTERTQGALATATSIRIRRVIEEHIANPDLNPDMIAACLGIGRTAVFDACRPLGGVMTMVRKRRLNKAYRQLLQNPQANISMMAYSLGFKSLDTFLRAFKREFGMTPKEVSQQQVVNVTADHKNQFTDWIRHAVT